MKTSIPGAFGIILTKHRINDKGQEMKSFIRLTDFKDYQLTKDIMGLANKSAAGDTNLLPIQIRIIEFQDKRTHKNHLMM